MLLLQCPICAINISCLVCLMPLLCSKGTARHGLGAGIPRIQPTHTRSSRKPKGIENNPINNKRDEFESYYNLNGALCICMSTIMYDQFLFDGLTPFDKLFAVRIERDIVVHASIDSREKCLYKMFSYLVLELCGELF